MLSEEIAKIWAAGPNVFDEAHLVSATKFAGQVAWAWSTSPNLFVNYAEFIYYCAQDNKKNRICLVFSNLYTNIHTNRLQRALAQMALIEAFVQDSLANYLHNVPRT